MASRTKFYQSTGLCVEFDHVYICDAQTNCIKILTSLKQTATFFNAVGKTYKAFSVHEKHQPYSLSSIEEAVKLVSGTLWVFREGNKDGMASRTKFYQSTGLCVEFDHVYVCDAQTNCIKILTSLKETATFLNAVGKTYKAFSVHEKHQPYSLSSIQKAVKLVSGTLWVLRSSGQRLSSLLKC